MTFREAIKELVKDIATKKHIRIGKAINIDADKCICDIDLGKNVFLYKAKLKAIEGDKDKGLVIVPKENTMVCAAMLEGVESNWVVFHYAEIDSWQIVTDSGGRIIVTNEGKVYLNGDDHDGLVMVKELVDRLNEIETKHDALVDDLNSHTHKYVTPSGPADTAPIVPPSMNKVDKHTSTSDIKSDKVFHGKGE